jgi:predicted transcriptional regulator
MMEIKLNTEKHEHITYNTEELGFTVLGGVRLEGLDRMRVTLKIEVINRKFKHYMNNPDIASLAIRHNIDLYNDTQVDKLIRKTADKLEVGVTTIATSIADITNQLEQYRLLQIEVQEKTQDKRKALTKEEHTAAQEFLSAPELMKRTSEAIKQSGVIGEENNALLMYTIFTSRKREHPLHIVSLGSSGMGKTYLQEKISELIPDEDKEEITALSENAFYYFGKTELKNKLILIEDLDGALSSMFPLRELQSKKRITKRISIKDNKGNTKTISVTVEGPICVAGCTTHETIYEDNANRSFLIYLDESKEQDELIMQRQRKASAGALNIEQENKIKTLIQNTQRILQPVGVRNPYAEHLKLPEEVFKPRRTNTHYLAFIEAITFYHQYQREHNADEHSGEIYIETTLADIEEANKLIKEILLRKSDELNTACRRYFEYLKAFLKTEAKTAFTAKEARQALRTNHSNQKRYMLQLLQNNYIKKSTGNKARGYNYEIVSYEEYETLKNSISTVLDDILNNLKEQKKNLTNNKKLNSSIVVHAQNEPLKTNKRKPKKQEVQKFSDKDNSIQKNTK